MKQFAPLKGSCCFVLIDDRELGALGGVSDCTRQL